MGDRDLDQLFLRYRDQGDVDALGALFDALAPELHRVAERLAPAPVGPDDLVQATFLTAIRRADRFDGSRPVTPWLVGLLATHAARARRREARRPDPERLPLEPTIDPSELASAGDLRAVVEGAVGRLPERYRAVVAGAVLDGRPPTDLAADLAREPGTVRVQLHRGLELLRRILPPSIATALVVRLLPHGQAQAFARAVGREVVMAEARAVAAIGASHPASPLLGVLLVNKSMLAAAALVAALFATWLATRGEGDDPLTVASAGEGAFASPAPGPTGPRPSTPVDRPGAEGLRAPSDLPEQVAARTPAAPVAEKPRALLVGTVVGLDPRAVAEARVVVEGRRGEEVSGRRVELGLVEGEGGAPRFEFELAPWLEEDAPESLHVSLVDELHRAEAVVVSVGEEPATLVAQLDATALCGVALRLVDEVGEPLGQHFAALFDFPAGREAPAGEQVAKGRSDDDGRLRMAVERVGRHALLSAAWKRRPATRVVELVPGETVDLGDVVLDRGETVSGVARRGDAFQPEGTVVVGRLEGAEDNYRLSVGNQLLQLDWVDEAFEHIHCANAVVAEGRFELLGMAPRLYSITVYVTAGEAQPEPLDVLASAEDVQIRDRAARIRLAVPAGFVETEAFLVEVTPEDGAPFERTWRPFQRGPLPLVVEPEAPVAIRVRSDVGHDLGFTLTAPAVGETVEYELDLADGPHGDLVLVAPEGLVLTDLEFIYFLENAEGLWRSGNFRVPADGELLLEDLPAGAWTLDVTPINAVEPTTLFEDLALTIVDGETLRRTLSTEAAGQVPVSVRSADGGAISAEVVRLVDGGELAVTVEARFAGVRSIRYDDGLLPASLDRALLLPPGRHQLRFAAEGHRPRSVAVEVRADERSAPLEVRLERSPEGAPE